MDPVQEGSSIPLDDIPEARREVLVTDEPESSSRRWWWLIGLLLVLLGAGGSIVWYLVRPIATATEDSQAVTAAVVPSVPESATLTGAPADPTLLGHRHYDEVDAKRLTPLTSNPAIKLKPAAAKQVDAMVAKALSEGVKLKTISGFRSVEDQQYLFFEIKAERGQTPKTRAEVSAPPGYSEHHTGYAIDFADGSMPQTTLEVTFETTPAFRWLQQNAARYGFELSFSKDNPQGVSYEPWHWRYVGDQESLETFYKE